MIDNQAAGFIRKGQVFKAITVKGDKTYLACAGRMQDGFVYFVHAGRDKNTDRAKITKHTYAQTINAIETGDIEPIKKDEVDLEKMGLLSLGLTAMSKRMNVSDYLDKRESGEMEGEDPRMLLEN